MNLGFHPTKKISGEEHCRDCTKITKLPTNMHSHFLYEGVPWMAAACLDFLDVMLSNSSSSHGFLSHLGHFRLSQVSRGLVLELVSSSVVADLASFQELAAQNKNL
jgi:hypothetical protein